MLELYKRIRQRREQLAMSQDELAKRLGYKSRSSINKIEKGENDIPQSKIVAFANALMVTPEYLMGWETPVGKTSDEMNLLNGYRNLNSDGKNLILNMIGQLSFSRSSENREKSSVGVIQYNKNGDNIAGNKIVTEGR